VINVTRTYLPPIDQYKKYLETIWENGWLTNNGALARQLREKLVDYLGVPNIELVANGTLALQLAIKALNLKGEVITTPFTYVATTTALLWENCEPVFVDIENKSFCIDAELIEAAITERTTAVLATHVYGYPCDVEKIERLANKYGLKVIYDAAHAFGVQLNGNSLLNHGDATVLSFHATKLFHTAEGGAVVCKDNVVAEKIGLLKKFGHIGEDDYRLAGINAKMSELHAAMGLCVLPMVDELITARRNLSELYDSRLLGSGVILPQSSPGLDYNYAYYPVLFPSGDNMLAARQLLMDNDVLPRRYFYPSLNTLPYVNCNQSSPCPVSEDIAGRILCLPLYPELETRDVEHISTIVLRALQ